MIKKYSIVSTIIFLFICKVYALDYKNFEAKSYTVPLRKFSLIATEEGYYPNNLVIFEGEKIELTLTSTTKDPSCFIMQEKNIFLEASKGKVSEAKIAFKRPGKYKFHCPSQKIEGRVTVLEKIKPQIEVKRAPAHWMPRDEEF